MKNYICEKCNNLIIPIKEKTKYPRVCSKCRSTRIRIITLEEIKNKINPSNRFSTLERTFVSIPKKVLKDRNEQDSNIKFTSYLDTYYGMIGYYSLITEPIEKGLGLRDVFFLLDKLKSKYPSQIKLIDSIKRRIALTEILEEEMKYLSQRFVWKEIENIDKIFIDKFENFMEATIELFLFIINLYLKKHPLNYKRSKLNELEKFSQIYEIFFIKDKNINSFWRNGYNSLYFPFYIYIRNMIVHDPDIITYEYKDEKMKIKIENLPEKRRSELYEDYLKDLLKRYRGKKILNSFQQNPIYDPITTFLVNLKLSKKCTPRSDETTIYFEMDILNLVKLIKGDLYILLIELIKFL